MLYIEVYFLIVATTFIHLCATVFFSYKKGADITSIINAKQELHDSCKRLVNIFGNVFGCLIISVVVIVAASAWVSVLPLIRAKRLLGRFKK